MLSEEGHCKFNVELIHDHRPLNAFRALMSINDEDTLLLCDVAFIREYADGDVLTVYMLRRGIADPSDYDTLQVTSALRYSDRLGLWTVLSRGVHESSLARDARKH